VGVWQKKLENLSLLSQFLRISGKLLAEFADYSDKSDGDGFVACVRFACRISASFD